MASIEESEPDGIAYRTYAYFPCFHYIPPSSISPPFSKLKDYSNFERWFEEFQLACRYKGIWNLFLGYEALLAKPRFFINDTLSEIQTSRSSIQFPERAEYFEAWRRQQVKIRYAVDFLETFLARKFYEMVQYGKPKDAFMCLYISYDIDKRTRILGSRRSESHQSSKRTNFSSRITGRWTVTWIGSTHWNVCWSSTMVCYAKLHPKDDQDLGRSYP